MDWNLIDREILVNPRLVEVDRNTLVHRLISSRAYEDLKDHLWILTSGSSGEPKWIALSREAFLSSAASVNRVAEVTSNDRWLNVLPLFHVGGLATQARAWLANSTWVDRSEMNWDPAVFVRTAEEQQTTLTSLVPSQVYDLVQRELTPPPTLRRIFVGGGKLTASTRDRALALGWPLCITYGLTESSSQVGLYFGDQESYAPLPHVEFRIAQDGWIEIKSPALLTGMIDHEGWKDPKVDGWFRCEDLGSLDTEGRLTLIGRASGFIKILGEKVSLTKLQEMVDCGRHEMRLSHTPILWSEPCERKENTLHLVAENELEAQKLVAWYQSKVMPYERIEAIRIIDQIPRTEMGKTPVSQLRQRLAEPHKVVPVSHFESEYPKPETASPTLTAEPAL